MKRIAICVLLLPAFTILAQQQIQFSATPLKPGTTFVRTAEYKMNFDYVLKFAGETLQEANRNSTDSIQKTETILETNGDSVTKIKVTYDRIEETAVITEDGIPKNEKPKPNPVAKRTYIVSVQNGTVKVTDQNGMKPDYDEIDIVSAAYRNLAEVDSFRQFFKQKTIGIGQPMQLPELATAGMFIDATRRKIKIENAAFTLKALQGDLALFDTALRMQWNEDENTSIKVNVSGEISVGTQNSRPLATNLNGTMRITGVQQFSNRLAMLDGKGKVSINETLKMK